MVKYATPQAGDLLLVFGDSFFADSIDAVEDVAMWERGEHTSTPTYFHLAVVVDDNYIVEALGRGLTLSPISKYAGSADVYSRNLTPHQRAEIVKQAMWMYEQHYTYDWLDLAVQFVRLIFRLRLPWKLKHSIICSVFGYVCYAAVGLKIAKLENCAPMDIALGGVLRNRGRLAGGVA